MVMRTTTPNTARKSIIVVQGRTTLAEIKAKAAQANGGKPAFEELGLRETRLEHEFKHA